MPKKGKNDLPKRKNEKNAAIISKVDTSRIFNPIEPTGPARRVKDIISPTKNVPRGRKSLVKMWLSTAVNEWRTATTIFHRRK
jgi:hypothetical protein